VTAGRLLGRAGRSAPHARAGPCPAPPAGSQARLDYALDLVDRAADAAAKGDQQALSGLVARMDRTEFDDFEERHPPSFALDVRFSEMVEDLVSDDDAAGFGDTWVDHLVQQADLALPPLTARWVRLMVGMAAEEYQLTNAELEAVERVRGGLHPDQEREQAIWLAELDQRPRSDLLREEIQALAWLRIAIW
jgi:hypothetical protein